MELKIYITIVCFFFGLIFGSFYNVVGWRIPKGLSIVKPAHSFCPKCKHKLKWYELIPVLSYLIQGGKCRACHEKIAPFYTIIELTTGILFALSYWMLGPSFEFLLAILTVSILSIVIVSDINFLIIPDQVTLIFSILVIMFRFICLGPVDAAYHMMYGFIAFLIMYLLMLMGNFVFKRESLGGGDIKLMFYVGCAIGPWMDIFSIFLSSFIALPLSIILYFKNKNNVIAFGPFILLSCLIIILFKIDINILFNI